MHMYSGPYSIRQADQTYYRQKQVVQKKANPRQLNSDVVGVGKYKARLQEIQVFQKWVI